MRTKKEVQRTVIKLRAELRMMNNLFPEQLTEHRLGHDEGYLEALEWVLQNIGESPT